jgi:hypothetical protein
VFNNDVYKSITFIYKFFKPKTFNRTTFLKGHLGFDLTCVNDDNIYAGKIVNSSSETYNGNVIHIKLYLSHQRSKVGHGIRMKIFLNENYSK